MLDHWVQNCTKLMSFSCYLSRKTNMARRTYTVLASFAFMLGLTIAGVMRKRGKEDVNSF